MQRESLNTSTPSSHFQSRSGMLKHSGGTYSHGGMMDYPRIPVAEWNPGEFPDSLEFQRWKVKFRTEVFSEEQPIFRSLCSGSKKLRWQNQLTNL